MLRLKTGLKPCPFCGGKARLMDQVYGYYKYYAYCSRCECRLQAFPTKIDAIKAWNERVKES